MQSTDSSDFRRSLTLDPSISPPADYRSYVPWAGFRLDYDSLLAGFYTISAGADPGFATLVDGSSETLAVLGVRTVKIYVPHHPDHFPAPGPGQRFMLTFGLHYGQATAVADENGSPLPFERIAARPLTYAGANFRLYGDAHRVMFPGFSDPKNVPGLYPLVEDSVTRRMNSLFGAHRIWTYGTVHTFCLTVDHPTCENPAPNQELYVVGIYRLRGYAENMAIGDPMGGTLEQPDSFRALDPLIVALRDRRDGVDAPNGYATFSDDWDLVRSYSLVSMEQSHPDWPASARNAILKQEPQLGMTRDMIAWMFGYPSDYGTMAQMNRLDTWVYTGPNTMDMTGNNRTFDFRNGRVEKCWPECKTR